MRAGSRGLNWSVIGSFFIFLVQLDHTFEKVPSHGGKQLDFCVLPQVAGVEGFASKKRVFKNLDAKIVLGKVPKNCKRKRTGMD
jgi:hypothetical protein